MARAAQRQSHDSPRDAVALLKSDHRQVEGLFEKFEEADDSELGAIAERVCQLLTVHAQIEEELLYPAAKQAFEEEEEIDLVLEAAVEHATAKDLIAKIEAMTPRDEEFKPTVKVLSEYIKHHVKEEEKEMFPKLKQTELDLGVLGGQLAERKHELMEQMGVEEEEAPARSRSGGATKAKRRDVSHRAASASRSRASSRAARH